MARLSKEQKELIRQSILDQSKILFEGDGYDQTSISKIAKAVGIAEGTIFNYFDTKADIFLEVIASDFVICKGNLEVDMTQCVSDIIYNFLYSSLKNIITIPKGVLKEILGASLVIAKKKPSLFKRFAQLDYQVLDELEGLLEQLYNKGMIQQCDYKIVAETIYGVIAFESAIYVYENDYSKEKMLQKMQTKIAFVMKACT